MFLHLYINYVFRAAIGSIIILLILCTITLTMENDALYDNKLGQYILAFRNHATIATLWPMICLQIMILFDGYRYAMNATTIIEKIIISTKSKEELAGILFTKQIFEIQCANEKFVALTFKTIYFNYMHFNYNIAIYDGDEYGTIKIIASKYIYNLIDPLLKEVELKNDESGELPDISG